MGYLPLRKCGLLLLHCRLRPTKKPGRLRHKAVIKHGSLLEQRNVLSLCYRTCLGKTSRSHASFTALPFLFKYCCFSSVIDTLKQMNSEFFMLLQFPWQFLHLFAFPNMYIWRDLYNWRIYLKKPKDKAIPRALPSLVLLWSNTISPFIFHLLQLLYSSSVTCISHRFKLQVFAAWIP